MPVLNQLFIAQVKQKYALCSANSKILVVGLGITGLAVVRFLSAQGFKCTVLDSRTKPAMLANLVAELPNIEVLSADLAQYDFTEFSHLVVSPGLSLNYASMQQAFAAGVIHISEIDLFCCATKTPIVAITGSNGKSTVTSLLGEMAASAGKNVAVGGNLGLPALDLLADTIELYILELSSFQLERVKNLNAAAATVLNISPDHLDRHGDLATYKLVKQQVFAGNGVLVLNADDAAVVDMQLPNRQIKWFSLHQSTGFHLGKRAGVEYLVAEDKYLMPVSCCGLEGQHNVANVLAALALGAAVNLDLDAMCTGLKNFQGLEHRMQLVAQINGIKWINDSKATNVGACIAALEGFKNQVILIAGGDAKGADLQILQAILIAKVQIIIVLGKDAKLLSAIAVAVNIPAINANSMQDAVQYANNIASVGSTVLLSPACASLDQYKNYQHRGDCFKNAVLNLAREFQNG